MLYVVVAEDSPDTKPASHEEVLAAVHASGLHVENIVKKIMTADIMGAYLETVPALEPYEIKKKAVVKKENTSEQAVQKSLQISIALFAISTAFTAFVLIRCRK